MSIRRMIPMGTTQRRCVVCGGYPIHATGPDLTAHERLCIEKMITQRAGLTPAPDNKD